MILPGNRRSGGLIGKLSDRQSSVRERLQEVRETEDKTIEEGLAGNLGYADDIVTAMVISSMDMRSEQEEEEVVTVNDLIWAGAFLDNLDTLGFFVRRKKKAKKNAS